MTKEQVLNGKKEVLTYLKNPWTKTEVLGIKVSRYFTDVDGVVIAKGTLPANLQTKIPFYLFGEFDRVGGYKYANDVCPSHPSWNLVDNFVGGVNTPFLFAAVGNTIHTFINKGDSVLVYTDNVDVPTYYCFVIINTPGGSYVSLMQNSNYMNDNRYGILKFKGVEFFSSVVAQFYEVIQIIQFDNLANVRKDSFNANDYLTPEYQESQSVTIPIKFQLNPLLELASYIQFTVDEMSFAFKVSLNDYQ